MPITGCRPELKPPCHVFDSSAQRCLCGERDMFNRKIMQPPRYTLAELKQLTDEWIIGLQVGETEDRVMRWRFSTFLAWLAQREQGKELGDVR